MLQPVLKQILNGFRHCYCSSTIYVQRTTFQNQSGCQRLILHKVSNEHSGYLIENNQNFQVAQHKNRRYRSISWHQSVYLNLMP